MNIFASLFPAVLDTAVKATILLGLAWLAGAMLRNRSAALRHTVRACALCAVLLLPVFSCLLPAWHWKGFSSPSLTANQSATITKPLADMPVMPESTSGGTELAPLQVRASVAHPASDKADPPTLSKLQLAANWPGLVMVGWLLGTLVIVLRLLVSRSRFAGLINKASPVKDASWSLQIHEIALLLGIRRTVALLESKDTEVPLTTGAFHPKIILSPDYSEWSPLRRDAILHHELAHILRLDTLAQALCQTAIAFYWFHPLVWLTARAMRTEREQACDDYVLAAGTRPSEYAHELLEIASSLRQPEFTAALAMARRSQLEGRVMALLNPAQGRGSISHKTTLTVVLLTLCAVLPLAAIQTAAHPGKNSQQKPGAGMATQSTPPAEATAEEPSISEKPAQPPEPMQPQTPQAAPAAPKNHIGVAPLPPTPPVDGITGGVAGGVPDGVKGGIPGGVRAVPALPPLSAPKPALAAPEIPPMPPVAEVPGVPAMPKTPRALPVPQAVPRPEAAPAAPRGPSTPPASASPAPKVMTTPRAASTASDLARLRAKLAWIHAQGSNNPQEIAALQAQIAAVASRDSPAAAPRVAELRAENAAMAARVATIRPVAAVGAQIAALDAATATTAGDVVSVRAKIAAIPMQRHEVSESR